MKPYATAQRKQLLAFFQKHPDRQFAVEEIAAQLNGSGISVSSIYRNISKMVSDGFVQRTSPDGSRRFLYQYVGEAACSEHLHLKCEKCGHISHMDSAATEAILAATRQSNFRIDKKKSILYGSCKFCD